MSRFSALGRRIGLGVDTVALAQACHVPLDRLGE